MKETFSGGKTPRIFNLGFRWREMVSFTLLPLFPPKGKSFGTDEWGPQPVLTRWQREKLLLLPGIE
jgi:hypothetical protein